LTKLRKKQRKELENFVTQSEVYKVFSRRQYREIDGYFDANKVQYDFAVRLLTFQKSNQAYLAEHEARYNIFFLLNTFYQRDLKFLWIGEELLAALLQTTPPTNDIEIKQVFPCGVIMLPQGKLTTPSKDIPVDWICFCHFSENDPETKSVTLGNGQVVNFRKSNRDALVWALFAKDSDKADVVYIGSVQAKDIYIHEEDPKQDQETSFVRSVSNLIVSVLLYLQIKPEQTEQTLSLKPYNRGFSVTDKSKILLNPYILGKDYKPRIKSANTIEVSKIGRTLRSHWRSGHWRNQPYKNKEDNETKYKLIWIKPILINEYQ